jgi:HK97 family phage portal protein
MRFDIFKRSRPKGDGGTAKGGGDAPKDCPKDGQEESSEVFLPPACGGGLHWGRSNAMLLSAVYRCVEVISDSVAQLPLEPYRVDEKGFRSRYTAHPTWYLLNREPDGRMSRFTFIKALVTSVLLNGNGYALIERDSRGDAVALRLLQHGDVSVYDREDFGPGGFDGEDSILYRVSGFDRMLDASEIIHVLNFSHDGVTGLSTLAHARQTIELATDSEAHAAGFFRGGANVAGIIAVEGHLNDAQANAIQKKWQERFTAQTGTPNGVVAIQGNMKFQPVTVNPADAQLLETRKFNVVDICRFFGVSPVKAFDLSNSSYSTVEATQLAFLTDTLAPLLEKIELEFGRKLYRPSERRRIEVKFDTSVLLRADKSSQAAYYNSLFQVGAISPNEIRRSLDMEAIEGGDHAFCQVNVQTLGQAVAGKMENSKFRSASP